MSEDRGNKVRQGILDIMVILTAVALLMGCAEREQKNLVDKAELSPIVEDEQIKETYDKALLEMPVSDKVFKTMQREMRSVAMTYQDIYDKADKGTASNPVISNDSLESIVKRVGQSGAVAFDAYGYTNMENYEQMELFCLQAEQGKSAHISLYQVNNSGGFNRMDLKAEDKTIILTAANMNWDQKMQPTVPYVTSYQIYQWEFTAKGYFLYRKYVPENVEMHGSYAIRVKPLKIEYKKRCEQYIKPISYVGNNLFLMDWDEQSLERINFNDLYEYIYLMKNGKKLDPDMYGAGIPKQEFEDTVQTYFQISADILEETSSYDGAAQKYQWQVLGVGSFTSNPASPIPEITDMRHNKDGTITYIVEAVWAEIRKDQSFVHEVTIREHEDGSFQYVSNYIRPSDNNTLPEYNNRIP